MDSIAMRKRAAWLEAVAKRLDGDQARHLRRYAVRLNEIADGIDTYSPRRLRELSLRPTIAA